MSATTTPVNPLTSQEEQHLIAGKRRRKIREAFVGYLFVLPAAIATFLFGLWPVVSGFYESLKSGSPLTNRYVGLDNYVRSLGSFSYVILFAISLIFLYGGYRIWRGLYLLSQSPDRRTWIYLPPGIIAGMGLIVLIFDLVTGVSGIGWVSATLLLLALAGYYAADRLQAQPIAEQWPDIATVWALIAAVGVLWIAGPAVIDATGLAEIGWLILLVILAPVVVRLVTYLGRIRTGQAVSASLVMSLMMLLGIIVPLYAAQQMQGDVEEAQRIAGQIFNQQVLNARVNVTDDDVRIGGLTVDGEIMVEVTIDGETVEAQLAPDAFPDVAVDRISRLETALANNQPVKVILPDGTEAEGALTGLPMGQHLDLGLLAENPEAIRSQQVYSALDIGENVIRAGGHTEPLRQQMLATFAIVVGLAAILLMLHARRQISTDERRLRRMLAWGCIALGITLVLLFFYLLGAVQLNRQAAQALDILTDDQFKLAYQAATGEAPRANLRSDVLSAELLYWPQVFLIGVGALLIGTAYFVWQSAQKRDSKLGFGLTIVLAVTLMVGGWLTISELPRTIALAGRDAGDTMDALTRTALYSIGTVPVQLALGLLLAYLLFSEITRGKSLFRVIYFMPYIAPSVATATVFLVIFSLNDNGLANKLLGVFGIDPLLWLDEPSGIFRIFYDKILGGNPQNIPGALQGPSLALFTVILYNIWVFAGYNTVVFLAGLGAIPRELYEAAEVDGAGRWARFRSVTLPLLSPTTFFLSMLSIIGTFKAFTHIYVLRHQAVGQEVDTMSVYIFNQLYSANDPGYAAALAFILFGVILVLTMAQNKLSARQVFYG